MTSLNQSDVEISQNILKCCRSAVQWILVITWTVYNVILLIIPPANEVAGVYSDPYVRPFVRSFVRPSQSLLRYSSKTAEQNFMKLSEIVNYMMQK